MFYAEDYEGFTQADYYEVSQKLDDAAEWFDEIIDILYGKKKFNVDNLENSLDELGYYLGRKLPKEDMDKKILNEWVEKNIQYLTNTI